ncbi:MAG: ABC-2 family transporter protein [Candidatus Hydrogenedentes bacterium]|nr:ABC-2 family transporter protein [Candidatus Hydrogenedentota bacterium]
MQYRASFLLLSLAQLIGTGAEFLALWALFARFRHVQGWTLPEVGLFYGIAHVAFALAESIARGFDVFPGMVKSGDFDRILLRPRSSAFQVLGQHFAHTRIGRLAQGATVLIWAACALDIAWTPARAALLAGAVAGGACLFSGLFILQAAAAFWTTESLEIANCFTYGGVETAQYPLTIYRPWFRRAFTFLIPLACVNYFPAHALLARPEPLGAPTPFLWAAPLIGLAFLLATLQFWRLGVRHYRSTGS